MSRVALVTGGSRGIGRCAALHLGGQGHKVAINYVSRADAAEEVAEEIRGLGGEAVTVRGDVGTSAGAAEVFATVTNALGPVEVLVNNAGITRDNFLVRMSEESWHEVMRVNLSSVYYCTKAAMRGMLRKRWGRVVSLSSVAGVAGNAGQANYAASKAGIIGFSKSVAKEVGSRGITVNVVAPGFITTDLTGELDDSVREAALSSISAGRWGTPDEVAAAVGFLASEAASYITGQVLIVDGGLAL